LFARPVIVGLLLTGASCTKEPDRLAPAKVVERPPPCSGARAETRGRLDNDALNEISGIVASQSHAGVLFVHNDSGDSARFFAVDTRGHLLAEFTLPGQRFEDAEDIAIAQGPGSKPHLYLGDIGDNGARNGLAPGRERISVYRVPEPDPAAGSRQSLPGAERLDFRYPDRPHDAEVLFADPNGGNLYIVTKESDGRSVIFRAQAPFAPGAPRTLSAVGRLDFGRGQLTGNTLTTAGDVNRAGDAIVIRTYTTTFVWSRPAGATIAEALEGTPHVVPTPPQPQGEAVAFAADGRGLFLVSEAPRAPLYYVTCN
jgi:hypothetical protein